MKTAYKGLIIILIIQFVFCCIEAYLISKISWIGRFGIRYFYKEYSFLRSGLKTALIFFLIQAAIAIILWVIVKRFNKKTGNIACLILFLIALTGLLITYDDFQHTYTHRLLKERFHLGFYLFWLCWMGTTIYFAIKNMIVHRIQRWPEDKSQLPASQ